MSILFDLGLRLSDLSRYVELAKVPTCLDKS
jgi:hypothetical protein